MQQNLCLVELRKCALSYFEIHLTQDNKNQKTSIKQKGGVINHLFYS